MTLEKALSYAIDNEGIGMISDPKLKNYLNDLQAYDTPAVKRIISTMIDEGYMSKIQSSLSNGDYELQFNDLANRLVQVEGFQSELVKYVMDCFLYVAHKSSNVPVIPQQQVETKKPLAKKTKGVKNNLKVKKNTGCCLVELNGQTYKLDETQFKAIMRKKDMPAERLEVWLNSYVEENN